MNELLSQLRRWPDVEAQNLFAADAADRLILDTCAPALQQLLTADPNAPVAVIGDHYGALTLGALNLGAANLRVHSDSLTSQRAITANLERLAPEQVQSVQFCTLSEAAEGCALVLMTLPRGLDVFSEQLSAVAAAAGQQLVLFAGGRIKHMSRSMNQVITEHFEKLDVSLARQKSRVLTGTRLRELQPAPSFPVTAEHQIGSLSFTLSAGAGTFGAARLDPGTRLMLENLPDLSHAHTLVDLACGNGSIGIYAARRFANLHIDASDHSASAVASTRAGALANGLHDRINVIQDDGLSRMPDASCELITLKPPFHIGNTVTADIAYKLIDEAARVLVDGGRLICVFNSHLRYRGELTRRIGPTEQLARDHTFTVTSSLRRR